MSGAGVTSAATCGPLSWCGGGSPAPGPCRGKVPGRPGPRPLAPPPSRLRPLPALRESPPPAWPRPRRLLPRAVAAGCGAPAGSGRPRLLGPCPHLRPPGPALRAPGMKVGLGRARVTTPKEQRGRSPFPKSWPGAEDNSPRAPRLPGAASRDLLARGNPQPAAEWAGR